MVKINNDIYDRLSTIPVHKHDTIIQYLLCLYFQLPFGNLGLSEAQRRAINTLGIINYNESEGIVFTTPLFKEEVVNIKHSFFTQFINLFPTNTVKTLGYDVKGSGAIAESKLKKFISSFNKELGVNYSIEKIQEVILVATTKYLAQRKLENYRFTMIAHQYVSHRDKGSMLESWCRLIVDEMTNGKTIDTAGAVFTNSIDL